LERSSEQGVDWTGHVGGDGIGNAGYKEEYKGNRG